MKANARPTTALGNGHGAVVAVDVLGTVRHSFEVADVVLKSRPALRRQRAGNRQEIKDFRPLIAVETVGPPGEKTVDVYDPPEWIKGRVPHIFPVLLTKTRPDDKRLGRHPSRVPLVRKPGSRGSILQNLGNDLRCKPTRGSR